MDVVAFPENKAIFLKSYLIMFAALHGLLFTSLVHQTSQKGVHSERKE